MSVLVTGGAGFIGSCVIRQMNEMGIDDIIVVDNIASTGKWMNLCNKEYREYVHKDRFLMEYLDKKILNIEAVIHMGACSATTEKNFDYLWLNNVEYSKILWQVCTERQIPFLYASSAATYGDGSQGFDDEMDISCLQPLNGYGYSKHAFDLWIKKQKNTPSHYAGFKFFNVYGPNEYNKDSMASMVYHGYKQIRRNGKICLFKSYRSDYEDGGQLRDFVYVKDVCKAILYFFVQWTEKSFQNRTMADNGIYNLGTGNAQSFRKLAEVIFGALGMAPNIEYIDMPGELQEKYQYYTQAKIKKLVDTGYSVSFRDIEHGVTDYVQNYLKKGFKIY